MEYKLLSAVKSPSDVKKMNYRELNELCFEIRQKMLETVSKNGGHLSSNLGAVELTVALHKVFDSPRDSIVFDVGHQCYAHKLITGRFKNFDTLRQKGGISGFCRPNESEHDPFYSGHSSTAVSAGLGIATANNLLKKDNYTVTVIGDGSFTGGMVYEALNNGGRSKTKHIIILNDNKMSISENVGAFAKYLAVIRSKPGYYNLKASTERTLNKIPNVGKKITQKLYNLKTDVKNKIYSQSTFFEDLGYRYMGPIDGHNITVLVDALEAAKKVNAPVLLHVNTVKGKGYKFAEEDPSRFHGVGPFELSTGKTKTASDCFSEKLGEYLCKYAPDNGKICAITAAMGLGTGLEAFRKKFPDRFFDVGIAEEHAVTFASGLAKKGLLPVFAVYSTFLQRCYDQLVHDVSLQKLKIIFAIDRAGFVGEDGETHNGLMDVAFLSTIPNIIVYSPCCYRSLEADINNAVNADKFAVALRYPRGKQDETVSVLKYNCIEYSTYGDDNADICIVTYGRVTGHAIKAVDELFKKGKNVFLISLNRIKPLPEDTVELIKNKKEVYFFEEGIRSGGIGERVGFRLLEEGFCGKYKLTAVPDDFVCQATVNELLEQYSLDANGIVKIISEEK